MRRPARYLGVVPSAALTLACCLAAVVGCKSQAQREAEAEVARIAFAVGQLRDAANNEKRAPLERLRAERCKVPVACELQQLCAQAYGLHLDAIDTANRVRQALRDGAENKEAAATLLTISEKDLAKAKTMMDRCVKLEGELTRQAM